MSLNPQDHKEILSMVTDRHKDSKFNYDKPDAGDFAGTLKTIRDRISNGEDVTKVMNAVIGVGDFGETFDIPLEEPEGFHDRIADQSALLNIIPSRFTSRASLQRNELTLGTNGQDVVRPGVEGTDPGDTVTLDTAKKVFTPQENIVIAAISDNAIEDNLEGAGLLDHLTGMLSRSIANETEKALLNGKAIGSTNSDRSSIDGMYDGVLEQCFTDGGNVVYATAYDDRYVSTVTENDKYLGAVKALPTQYGLDGKVWLSPRTIIADYAADLAQRGTLLGDQSVQRGYRYNVTPQGQPMFECAGLRTNHIVKGTGTVQASSPLDTVLTSIAKSRQSTMTVTTVTNEANNNIYVVGCDAAGTSFDLRAEHCVQVGAASGDVITIDDPAVFARDHAAGEIVTEYSAAPTLNGICNLLIDPVTNIVRILHRVLRIETYRLPRVRTTAFILTWRDCVAVLNPDDSVIIRDLLAR